MVAMKLLWSKTFLSSGYVSTLERGCRGSGPHLATSGCTSSHLLYLLFTSAIAWTCRYGRRERCTKSSFHILDKVGHWRNLLTTKISRVRWTLNEKAIMSCCPDYLGIPKRGKAPNVHYGCTAGHSTCYSIVLGTYDWMWSVQVMYVCTRTYQGWVQTLWAYLLQLHPVIPAEIVQTPALLWPLPEYICTQWAILTIGYMYIRT